MNKIKIYIDLDFKIQNCYAEFRTCGNSKEKVVLKILANTIKDPTYLKKLKESFEKKARENTSDFGKLDKFIDDISRIDITHANCQLEDGKENDLIIFFGRASFTNLNGETVLKEIRFIFDSKAELVDVFHHSRDIDRRVKNMVGISKENSIKNSYVDLHRESRNIFGLAK